MVIDNDVGPTPNTFVGRLVTCDFEATPRLLGQEGHQRRGGSGCSQYLVAMAKKPQGDHQRPSGRSDRGEPHGDHGVVEEGINFARCEGSAKIGDVHCATLGRSLRRGRMRRSLTALVGAESALLDIAEDSILVSNNPDTKQTLGLPQSDEAFSKDDAMETPLKGLRTANERAPRLESPSAMVIGSESHSLAHARRCFAAMNDGRGCLPGVDAGERSSGIRVR